MNQRRLIEEYLPLAAVHEEASRQKGRRRPYHISAIHYWWARRPLPAARAAVYAALVSAPESLEAAALDARLARLCRWDGTNKGLPPADAVRDARTQILDAHGGKPAKVLDQFAGGGAIPLEAARLGCETTALELNPVAHLIELCSLDYPQRFGPELADEVARWGRRLIDRTRDEIGHLYPALGGGDIQTTLVDGEDESISHRVPIAYLWTRTVPCPNRAVGAHDVPIVRQTWLVKKTGNYVALRMLPDRERMKIEYQVVASETAGGLGFDPEGHSKRGSTTCPLCGAAVDLAHVKIEAKAGRMSAELMAVSLVPVGGRGKTYVGSETGRTLIPDSERLARILVDLADQGLVPPQGRIAAEDNQHFQVPMYGMTSFSDLFTDRQLAMLLTLCQKSRDCHTEMLEEGIVPERARAISTYLAMLIDRAADYSSTLCHWHSRNAKPETTFARQALPMTWDFAEVNPFGGAAGDLLASLSGMIQAIEHCARSGQPVRVVRGSADELPFEDSEFDAVITDPPYYDNITYADLSDYFYVWLKLSAGHLHPEHLSAELTPKRREIIAVPYRHAGSRAEAKAAYEEMMERAFSEARRVLKPEGIMVCVYAHQTTAGWATLIEAVRRAGFVVVEAWPVDTEMQTRGVAMGTAALASSIFLVSRPRTTEATGDWAHDVRPGLTQIVSERVEELSSFGITGTDLVIAAVGAGMRAYTKYGRVEKPNGEELSPDEYLGEVEREVAEAVLARIFGTDKRGLGRVDQATQFYVMGRFEFGDALAPWDELNTLARGTGVELAPLVRGTEALVAFGDKRDRARLLDYRDRGSADDLGLDGMRSTIDHLHRILWLNEREPGRLTEYLAQARPDAERLRLVAHALARPGLDTGTRTPEADACERLLAVWRRVVQDNLFAAETA